jgi:hypothetical protein
LERAGRQSRRLQANEAVYVVEGHRAGGPVADGGGELLEVVVVVTPGTGLGVAAAQPVDEAVNLD